MPNTGTLTGLTPATEHILDAVHVDAWGNVSDVVSSMPFTTGAAASATTPPFATKRVFAGSDGAGGVYTWPNAPLGNGEAYIGVGYLSGGAARTVSGFAVGAASGLIPEIEANSANVSATRIYKVTSDGSPADITLTLNANAVHGVVMFLWTPGSATTVIDTAASSGIEDFDPAIVGDVTTEADGKVIALASVFGGITFNNLTGLSLVADGRVDLGTNDIIAAFEADTIAATPRSVRIGSTESGVQHAAVVLSLGAAQ
jgi:hypothetical protein